MVPVHDIISLSLADLRILPPPPPPPPKFCNIYNKPTYVGLPLDVGSLRPHFIATPHPPMEFHDPPLIMLQDKATC